MITEYKTCSKCNLLFPATTKYYYKRTDSKDGLFGRCKYCIKITRPNHHSTINRYLRHLFNNMKQRCCNLKRKDYERYGGRGIKVIFQSANEFIEYVVNVLQIDPRDLQIDRINNDGNYEKGNIRFVTAKENMQNQRRSKQKGNEDE